MATKTRTKAEQAAITKKAQATRRKNLRAGTPAKRKTTTAVTRKKRRSPAKKKGLLAGLGDFGSVENRNTFRTMVSGSVGGMLYQIYDAQVTIPAETPEKKLLYAAAGAYLLSMMGKKPSVAAGALGAATYDFFKEKGFLADGPLSSQVGRQQWADPLQNIPVTLSDNQMMSLQAGMHDNGMYLQDDNMALQDGQYLPDYAPTYRY